MLNRILSRLYFEYNKVKLQLRKKIYIHNKACELNSISLYITGKRNILKFGKGCRCYNCKFIVKGNNNSISIEENCRIYNTTFWIEDDKNIITIGKYTTIEGGGEIACLENTSIIIGNDCMLSNNVKIRTSDSHSIICNGERVNKAQNIIIGNHVWIGYDAMILKGSYIPDNSIVGAKSLVTRKKTHSNSIIAGIPAKTIFKDIEWTRERIKV